MFGREKSSQQGIKKQQKYGQPWRWKELESTPKFAKHQISWKYWLVQLTSVFIYAQSR